MLGSNSYLGRNFLKRPCRFAAGLSGASEPLRSTYYYNKDNGNALTTNIHSTAFSRCALHYTSSKISNNDSNQPDKQINNVDHSAGALILLLEQPDHPEASDPCNYVAHRPAEAQPGPKTILNTDQGACIVNTATDHATTNTHLLRNLDPRTMAAPTHGRGHPPAERLQLR